MKRIEVLKNRQDVVMNVLNKFIFYIPRIIHILLLPMMYVVTLWFPNGKYWEVIGLVILILIPFYSLVMKKCRSYFFWISFFTYILVIYLFFPEHLFSEKYPLDYKNIIFFDMLLLLITDTYLYFKNKKNYFY